MQFIYLLVAVIVLCLAVVVGLVMFMISKINLIIETFLKHIDNLELKVKSDNVFQYNQVDAARKAEQVQVAIQKQIEENLDKQEGKNNDELPDLYDLESDPLAKKKFIMNFKGIVEE